MSYNDLIKETQEKIALNKKLVVEKEQAACKEFANRLPKILEVELKINLEKENPSSTVYIKEPSNCKQLVDEFLTSKGFKRDKNNREWGTRLDINIETKKYSHGYSDSGDWY